MNKFTKALGLILITGVIAWGCDSVTESQIDNSEKNNQVLALEADNGANNKTIGSEAKSLGKVTFDTEVSSWDIGTGIPNGEFVTAEAQGVVIGLRALGRFVGLLGVTGDNGNRVGVYEAETGPSPREADDNNGTWNYDFHVDLSGATGKAKGKTLSDYRLVLEQDFTQQSLYGALGHDPVELPMVSGICDPGSFDADNLCQQSWNPGFGNDDYDPDEERTYNLRLVLTPETFNGNPLAVAIRVDVQDAD